MGWLLLVVVVVLGVPAAAYLAQDRLLFLPHLAARPGAVRPPRAVEEIAFATADGPQVRGWLAPARSRGSPRAHSAAVIRRLPGGCTSPSSTGQVPVPANIPARPGWPGPWGRWYTLAARRPGPAGGP